MSTPAAFHADFMDNRVPALLASGDIERLVVNLVAAGSAKAAAGAPLCDPFDIVVEMWGDAAGQPFAGAAGHWLVEEITEKDDLPRVEGQVTPGIRSLPFVLFKDHLDAQGRRDRWAAHGQVGLRIHTGAARFLRNVVLETIEPASPILHGVTMLNFATVEDMQTGLFPTPEGLAEFLADVADFAAANTGHHAIEHVLRWPAPADVEQAA
jgi:hypothetical protein